MTRPISSSLPSSASRISKPDAGLLHVAALLGIGVVLAGVHQAWDLKLGLPGHYGLIWMAGLMATRHWSGARWAAVLAACGYVVGTAAFTGFVPQGVSQAPAYAISALAVDLLWRAAGVHFTRTAVAAFVGGFAFLLKPLAMLGLALGVGLEIGALRHGQVFPLVTHFAFGLTGAVLGTLAWRAAQPTRAQA